MHDIGYWTLDIGMEFGVRFCCQKYGTARDETVALQETLDIQ